MNTLEGNPGEMRSAVINEFREVNPVQLGKEDGIQKAEDRGLKCLGTIRFVK